MARSQQKKKAPEKETKRTETNSETPTRLAKVSGLILAVFAAFTLLAVTSYLFTWEEDQSLVSDPEMMSQSVDVNNIAGKLGFKWSRFLVGRCFGLGSYALVILFFVAAAKLFFRKNKWSFRRSLILTVTGAIISSVLLAFCSSFIGNVDFLEGGLGGDCGTMVSALCTNIFGDIVTGLLIAISIIIWLLYASGAFAKWFNTLGEREPRKKEKKEKKKKTDSIGADSPAESSVRVLPEESEEQTALEENPENEDIPLEEQPLGDGDDRKEQTLGEDDGLEEQKSGEEEQGDVVLGAQPAASASAAAPAAVVAQTPADQSIEIEDGGDDISEAVKKDLPRIDTREELSKYKFPSLDLLSDYRANRHDVPMEELERNNNKIRSTLASYRIEVEKVTACKGPTVTLYKVTPAPGVKIASIRNLEEDIAMALGSKGVRVVTLPDVVGIEVPNARPSIVPLKSLLNDPAYRENDYELPVAMGYTVTQKVKVFDLTDAPHVLVAGATKQGKSVGLSVVIASLLYAKHPSELKLVFIDPKMVEFNAYAKLLKHYLAVLPTAGSEEEEKASAIVKHPKDAETTLRSLCLEMDERYTLMSQAEVNNVKSYNEKYKDRHLNPQKGHRYLPYIVVVIDEYAELMTSPSGGDGKKISKSIENSVIRLAQKGRAAGIHVIIATQRPSVNVITGLIKANFPMRIAFKTGSSIDSKTILDRPGADKLIGRGDMLLSSGVEMERMQCAMVSMEEINTITDFIGSQTAYKQCYNTPYYLPMPAAEGGDEDQPLVDMQNIDALFKEAAEFVVINQKGSTSLLQRKFGVGFARAGKIMDQLEAAGIVGPQDGSKPRMVLVPDLNTLQGIFDAYLK